MRNQNTETKNKANNLFAFLQLDNSENPCPLSQTLQINQVPMVSLIHTIDSNSFPCPSLLTWCVHRAHSSACNSHLM